MVSSGMEKLFTTTWKVIKLNLYFHLFSLLGGYFLGIGPAFQMVSDLVQKLEVEKGTFTFNEAFVSWKSHFIRANLLFWSCCLASLIFIYNLFLSVQLQGLIWFIVDFILIASIVILANVYLYGLLYETNYLISMKNLLKLSLGSVFLNFSVLCKLTIGVIIITVVSWQLKGLLLFATFSSIMILSNKLTIKQRALIDRRIIKYEI